MAIMLSATIVLPFVVVALQFLNANDWQIWFLIVTELLLLYLGISNWLKILMIKKRVRFK
jgi:hypothetical protein